MLVVLTGLRGVVDFGELEDDLVVALVEPGVLVECVLGVEDVFLGSAYVLVEVRSEDEYEDVLRAVCPEVLRVPVVLVDLLSVRAFRCFLILCAVTPARVASNGAAKMLTTEAQSIAKKHAPREGLHPSMR